MRSIETESKNENIGEMKSINTEIIENVIGIVNLKSIKNKEDIDFAIDSNLIIELLDLLRRTPIDLISMNLITLL
ncbi:hypothetical protein EZS27_023627 [termite gut metagenome]|uniref:Uncharacterized protein n=1 Tax=termite gut metagenome TaxID=433724 RepID=A0A5J4R1C4_9ZZZZ